MRKCIFLSVIALSLTACNQNIATDERIHVFLPLPDAEITFPLEITGEARGYWFFEATFPIEVLDADGTVLAESFATADGDWMTEEFVPFSATMNAEAPVGKRGSIRLNRANASGLPENDAFTDIPVHFADR